MTGPVNGDGVSAQRLVDRLRPFVEGCGCAPLLPQRDASQQARTLNVILTGARGGQGTSTIAAATALYAVAQVSTQLVAVDTSATAAVLGLPEPSHDEVSVTEQFTLTNRSSGDPVVRITDAGTTTTSVAGGGVRLVVLRGPCYVALRGLVRGGGRRPDGIVLLVEPGRSLSARDVEDMTGVSVVATVPVTPTVARAIDAGLFVARLHRLSDLAALRRHAARSRNALRRLQRRPNRHLSRCRRPQREPARNGCQDRHRLAGCALRNRLRLTTSSRSALRARLSSLNDTVVEEFDC